jgi:hypothetical protein
MLEGSRLERRREDAAFIRIERRGRGSLWKYGSVALVVGLWGILVGTLLR